MDGWACLPRTSHPNPSRLCPHCPASQHSSTSPSGPQPRTLTFGASADGIGTGHRGECALPPALASRAQDSGLQVLLRTRLGKVLLTPRDLQEQAPKDVVSAGLGPGQSSPPSVKGGALILGFGPSCQFQPSEEGRRCCGLRLSQGDRWWEGAAAGRDGRGWRGPGTQVL